MDPSPSSPLLSYLQIFQPIDFELGLSVFAVVVLVILSALLSGSEVAMFSISNKQRSELEDQDIISINESYSYSKNLKNY